MPVDCAGVFPHQRRAQCADGALIAASGKLAEKDIAGVLPQNFGEALRILPHIGFDALHGGLPELEVAFVRHIASDGNIRMLVFVGIADADVFAGRGFQTARALYVHEKKFDGVFGVTEYRGFAVKRAAVDLVARVVGEEAASFKPALDCRCARGNGESGKVGGMRAAGIVDCAAVFSRLPDADKGFPAPQTGRQGDGDKIVGNAVNREAGPFRPPVVALQHRLVIAGNRTCKASVACNLPRREIAFKKPLCLKGMHGGLKGLGAHILPALAVFQIGAAEAEGLQAFGKILRRPVGHGQVRHNGIDGPAAGNRRSGGVGDAGRPVRAVDDGCVGLRKGLDAPALAGGEDGGGDAVQGGAEQVFFHNGQCCRQ